MSFTNKRKFPNDYRSALAHQDYQGYQEPQDYQDYQKYSPDSKHTALRIYSANTGRNAVNEIGIYRDQNEFAWSARSRFSSPKTHSRQGAAFTRYRDQPVDKNALDYHQNMYPPNYTDMWN